MDELNNGWQIIKGKLPFLLVAGHNFGQLREGKIKLADLGTGDIVRNLAEKFECWGIVSTRIVQDPNWYPESPFRGKIKEIIKEEKIKMIIDIHGSNLGKESLITIKMNKCFEDNYKNRWEEVEIEGFKKNRQVTLAEELEEIPVLEIEIREDGRVNTIETKNYDKSQKILEKIVKNLVYSPKN